MNFDNRQNQRKVILDRIMLAAQVLAIVYLAAHALITWKAFEVDGIIAALLTLVLLGFGDLYWGLRWAWEGQFPWQTTVALVTATLCFASWATRRRFNRWMNQFTIDMLQDFGDELKTISTQADQQDAKETQSDDDGNDPPHDGNKT